METNLIDLKHTPDYDYGETARVYDYRHAEKPNENFCGKLAVYNFDTRCTHRFAVGGKFGKREPVVVLVRSHEPNRQNKHSRVSAVCVDVAFGVAALMRVRARLRAGSRWRKQPFQRRRCRRRRRRNARPPSSSERSVGGTHTARENGGRANRMNDSNRQTEIVFLAKRIVTNESMNIFARVCGRECECERDGLRYSEIDSLGSRFLSFRRFHSVPSKICVMTRRIAFQSGRKKVVSVSFSGSRESEREDAQRRTYSEYSLSERSFFPFSIASLLISQYSFVFSSLFSSFRCCGERRERDSRIGGERCSTGGISFQL